MMPFLFSLGQQGALNAVQPTERFFAHLDDIYFVRRPQRVGGLYAALQDALRRHAGIQIHCGKTQIWNRAGVRPREYALESAAARICGEAVGRVTTNVMVRDLDLAVPNVLEGWKLWSMVCHCSVGLNWL